MNTRVLWPATVLAAVISSGGMPGTVVGQALAQTLPSGPGAVSAQTTFVGTPAGYSSGIEGRIMLGPMCPEARGAICVDRPYGATVIVRRGDGAQGVSREFTRFRSNGDGHFRVALPPGVYQLVPVSGNRPYPRAGSQTVVVRRNQFTRVVIRYDTGIR